MVPECGMTLLRCVPESGKLELIIQKCGELGIYGIARVTSQRCGVKLDAFLYYKLKLSRLGQALEKRYAAFRLRRRFAAWRYAQFHLLPVGRLYRCRVFTALSVTKLHLVAALKAQHTRNMRRIVARHNGFPIAYL